MDLRWRSHTRTRLSSFLMDKMSELLQQGDHITCIAFNYFGDWIVISDNHFLGSNDSIHQNIIEARNRYGFIRSVDMTNYGYIIVAEKGFREVGLIPPDLDDYLTNKQSFDIHCIKFTERGSWLVTDGDSQYAYYLR